MQVFEFDNWGKMPVDKKLSDIRETLQKLSDKVKKAGKTKAIPWAETANLAVLEAQYAFITKHQEWASGASGPVAPGTETAKIGYKYALVPLDNWVRKNTSGPVDDATQFHPASAGPKLVILQHESTSPMPTLRPCGVL